jgi:hypothetical protein
MTDAIVEELEHNIKLVMKEYQLDRNTFTFTSGLEFIAAASPELTEELFPEVFKGYIEVEQQSPPQATAAPSPPNAPVSDNHPENIDRPVEHLGPVFATGVIVRTILSTPNVTAQNVLDALKKLNLMPGALEEAIYQRIERMLQIRRELRSHVHIPLGKHEGLIFEECRNRIVGRLSQRIWGIVKAEYERQTAKPSYSQETAEAARRIAWKERQIAIMTLTQGNSQVPSR